jgi:hypothetical protein
MLDAWGFAVACDVWLRDRKILGAMEKLQTEPISVHATAGAS